MKKLFIFSLLFATISTYTMQKETPLEQFRQQCHGTYIDDNSFWTILPIRAYETTNGIKIFSLSQSIITLTHFFQTNDKHPQPINSKTLATTTLGSAKHVNIWNLEKKELMQKITTHKEISGIKASKNQKSLNITTKDNKIYHWSLNHPQAFIL